MCVVTYVCSSSIQCFFLLTLSALWLRGVTGGVAVKNVYCAVTQLTHLRPFLTADILTRGSSRSVTNNNIGNETEVLSVAGGQMIMSLNSKKKGRKPWSKVGQRSTSNKNEKSFIICSQRLWRRGEYVAVLLKLGEKSCLHTHTQTHTHTHAH